MRRRQHVSLETAEALLEWGRTLDNRLKGEGAMSSDTRRTALLLIDAAKVEATLTHHRGGHHSTARRALMPWEVEREERIGHLIEVSLRGRLTRRTGALARATCSV